MVDVTKFYTDDALKSDGERVFHGFFTRLGGISTGVYKGLNCAYNSHDEMENIHSNRALVAQSSGVTTSSLVSLNQVHGADVVQVHEAPLGDVHADAMVTDTADIALGVLTADCAPVLLSGQKENGDPVIGAAHAGSKGALGGVLDNCFKAMIDLGAQSETIKAAVGPSISKSSYEVSQDFQELFIKHNDEAERFFSDASKVGHFYFDLPAYCAWRLFLVGCKTVSLTDIDTYTHEEEFFSFRRSTHRQEKDYGRQISVISIHEK